MTEYQIEPAVEDNDEKKRKQSGSEETEKPAERRNKGVHASNDNSSAAEPIKRRTRANAASSNEPAPILSEPERKLANLLEHGPTSQRRKAHVLVGGSERLVGTIKNLLCSHRMGEEFVDNGGLLRKIENDSEGGNVTAKDLNGEARALAIAKIFGSIDGTDVGRVFPSRKELRRCLAHRVPIEGIFGDEGRGAYSIVSSGKYQDDEENEDERGETFFFTGEGE